MANKLYPNHVLENRFEDQYNSKLDLMQFCTVDDSLVGTAGDTKKINTYTATDGTQVLAMGEGNTEIHSRCTSRGNPRTYSRRWSTLSGTD